MSCPRPLRLLQVFRFLHEAQRFRDVARALRLLAARLQFHPRFCSPVGATQFSQPRGTCFPDIRTIHLHVVEHRGSQGRDYLRFRDLLRQRPAIRKRYAELKRDHASICMDDRESYTASKGAFIQEVLDNNVNRTDDSSKESRRGVSPHPLVPGCQSDRPPSVGHRRPIRRRGHPDG